MKVESYSIHVVGPPESPCKCGEGEWLEAQPGDLIGYRCSACWRHDIGQIEFGEAEEREVEVTVEEHPDGSATLRFGEGW